ncbi:MAG: hypothetical protein QF464_14685, partial [Myxococcota bacterium]|nr:hypothetical protein [Myxococcota bacterium]
VGIEAFGIFTPLQLVCQTQTEWTDMVLDLLPYKNLRVQLAFRFFANDTQNAGFGAAVDGIEIDAVFSCIDDDICTTGETCQEGTCELAEVACDDDDPCTADACSPVDGCVHTPQDDCLCEIASDCPLLGVCAVPTCVDGVCEALFVEGDCDGEDPCVTNGVCDGGVCVGEAVICDDDNLCTTDQCDSEVGCLFSPHSEACDDGDPCTDTDHCQGGVCAGTAKDCNTGNLCALGTCIEGECFTEPLHDGQVLIGDDFDDLSSLDLPTGWLQESTHPEWAWSLSTTSSVSPPNAIAATGPIDWSDEPVILVLDTPEFTVPFGGGSLAFDLSMALGDETCDDDTLTVTVGADTLTVLCESTPAWAEHSLPLSASDGPVSARFELALSGDTASFVDVRVDDVEVLGNYPCAVEDPCFDGVCVVGQCFTTLVETCE